MAELTESPNAVIYFNLKILIDIGYERTDRLAFVYVYIYIYYVSVRDFRTLRIGLGG